MTTAVQISPSSPATDSRWFYRDLPVLASFEEAANGQNHTPLPDDWFIVICDVVGSTKAIEEGKYKNVNTIGAATIVSVLNVDRSIPVPYVFGGDGASLAIPACMEMGARRALLGSQALARTGFNLDLRIGIVSVREAKGANDRVAIGRYSQSPGMFQSSLSGFGWDHAEKLLKDENTRTLYEVVETPDCQPEADFTGFECRWRPVAARNDHKLAILVQSLSKDASQHMAVYSKVLAGIQTIYGELSDSHPLDVRHLVIALNPREAIAEIKVRTQGLSLPRKLAYGLLLAVLLVLGRILMGFGLSAFGVNWGGYKKEVVENSDFRKFDGMLKMVVDGSEEQRERLEHFLQAGHKEGAIVYGLHASKSAIVTCLVFSHEENHSHFVDGSDGGYTMASKMLKSQLAAYRANKGT